VTPENFIKRWLPSGGSEQANAKLFLPELADLVGAPRPDPAVPRLSANDYVFERRILLREDDSNRYIDLYKRGCFVLEAKQSRLVDGRKRDRLEPDSPDGSFVRDLLGDEIVHKGHAERGGPKWGQVMRAARNQAETYVRNLPDGHETPPFIIICDVGYVLELWSNFARDGKAYTQFPDRSGYRITLEDLAKPEVRDLLRTVWTDPMSLDPARKSAEVSRDIAERLARVARELEKKHYPEQVALFLMRCLFTMFAEDVGLLPDRSFTEFLKGVMATPDKAHLALKSFWREMDAGTEYSSAIKASVRRFNGGLFRNADALPLTSDMLGELYQAARRDWRDVEPAIFGTLLEQALSKQERSKLGAHYTPRAYVERLVIPTIIEPLREEWTAVQAECELAIMKGDNRTALVAARWFHQQLCSTDILDPACGTGNFLYVAFEHMKRLEGEVLDFIASLPGSAQEAFELKGFTVDPSHFHGIEKNPRAREIAELVLWIGYLKWQLRTNGHSYISDPVLADFKNIECRDAVLAWEGEPVPRLDGNGEPVTRWDGVSQRTDGLTGNLIPDESHRVPVLDYPKPAPAVWPRADFIIGNPPFIGGKDLRAELGDGYAEALWKAWPHMPGGADFVLYWWDHAAELVRAGNARRFGFITTNSITQVFGRRVIDRHLNDTKAPLHIEFAISDHPWVKGEDRANVRIAMTVGAPGARDGALWRVVSEADLNTDTPKVRLAQQRGMIRSHLEIGADISSAHALKANDRVCSPGVKLHGSGFIVTPQQAQGLGLGTVPGLDKHILPYRNGRDINQTPRGVMVIDLFGLTEDEVRARFPAVYQHVRTTVWPEREQNNREIYRTNWWIFGEPRRDLRPALAGIPRLIATTETSKHRFFTFLPEGTRPDNKLVCIAHGGAEILAVLSSRFHCCWALAAGGWLGVGNDPVYIKTRCFDPFPFPETTPARAARLAELGEGLDAHRKAILSAHSDATLTDLYNVLTRVREIAAPPISGMGPPAPLSPAERDRYDRWQIGVLKSLHDDIDRVTAESYGWPVNLSDDAILENLVRLNHERAAEERRGRVRWLRPDFQNPTNKVLEEIAQQMEADLAAGEAAAKPALPTETRDRVKALLAVIPATPASADAIAANFKGAKRAGVKDILDVLAASGRIEVTEEGLYFKAAA
jgi:hypothetical protein